MEDLPEFDEPIFKRLAANDTGNAPGHQGGILIPKAVEAYFPDLSGAGPANPTVEQRVNVILNVPGKGTSVVESRYQHQTWGGTRAPERRLTDNLTFLRNEAHEDDFLIIERGLHNRESFRLTLLKTGTPEFKKFLERVGSRRWGAVSTDYSPVRDADVRTAESAQAAHENDPLVLFDNAAATSEARVIRIARSAAFQKRVVTIYEKKCALCGKGLLHPATGAEVEAAHIVPRSLKGADDARNGLALCRTHHWAFDRGLFGVQKTNVVFVPEEVKTRTENSDLASYEAKPLRGPSEKALAPAPEALQWHFENIVMRHSD